jgi:hypothetical protein
MPKTWPRPIRTISVPSIRAGETPVEIHGGIQRAQRRKTGEATRRPRDVVADDTPQFPFPGCMLATPPLPNAHEISYQGGPLANGAPVQLLFWGDVWADPATSPSAGDITAAMQTMVEGSYLFPLKQYGVSSGPFNEPRIVTSPAPGATISADDLHDMLWSLAGHTFPYPDQDGGRNLYVVVLPPGARGLPDDSEAAHSSTWRIVFEGAIPRVVNLWYAWTGVTPQFSVDQITGDLSHEIAEAYTNPEPNGGWVIGNSDDPGETEIADLCEDIAVDGEVDGVRVAPYYSKINNACILPTARSVRLFLTIKGIDGTNGIRSHVSPGTSLRQFLKT